MKLKTYYCNIDNFGDKLNEYIFLKFLNLKIKRKSLKKSKVMGIGSLLDNCLLDSNDLYFDENELKIFSTGFGFEEGGFFHNKNIILPEKLKRKIKCYALRGYLTKARIEKLLDTEIDVVVGDGGLLASELIDLKNVEKKYELGIVPHYADMGNSIFSKIQQQYTPSIILDVRKDPIDFLIDLASCKAIISTAMHPLIASDSLGIPNLWGRISEETTSRYKFADYYSVFSKDKEPLDLLHFDFVHNDLVKLIHKNYDISPQIVLNIKKELLVALKFLKKDLERENILYKILCLLTLNFGDRKFRLKVAETLVDAENNPASS